ncbi:MAG: hypothetical protein LBM02_02245 [Lachnospiraceae bacterium]|jgi:hypothetical protein|nr:hypothetical protein [Lachnospiraceae bacterium]
MNKNHKTIDDIFTALVIIILSIIAIFFVPTTGLFIVRWFVRFGIFYGFWFLFKTVLPPFNKNHSDESEDNVEKNISK